MLKRSDQFESLPILTILITIETAQHNDLQGRFLGDHRLGVSALQRDEGDGGHWVLENRKKGGK